MSLLGLHHFGSSSEFIQGKMKIVKFIKGNVCVELKISKKLLKKKPLFLSKVDPIDLCQTLFSFIFYFQGPKGFQGDKGDRVST